MRGWGLCLVAVLLSGCDPDPARSVKIISRPSSTAGQRSPSAPLNQWHPNGCPPPAEKSVGSEKLSVAGPCTFEHRAQARCHSKLDDFFVIVERPAANGARLTLFINVEHYKGPGEYLLAQTHLNLQDGAALYRWSSDNVSIKVGPDESFVELPATTLEAEPLTTSCKPEIAADGSYQFPCSAKKIESPVDGTTEILFGKILCTTDSGAR